MHDAGYEELVIKVDNSIGGLGQVVSSVNEVLQQGSDGNFSQYFPYEFTPEDAPLKHIRKKNFKPGREFFENFLKNYLTTNIRNK